MTKAQINKLHSIPCVLNYFENHAGELVIDSTYGSNKYVRMWISPRGGFTLQKIYKQYDFEDKMPYKQIFEQFR